MTTKTSFGNSIHPLGFPVKSLSFWTSLLAVAGLFSRHKSIRSVTGFAGLLCGLGGAGLVYERICAREGIPREPIEILKHASRDDMESLIAHVLFGIVGAFEVAYTPKRRVPRL